MKKCILTSKKAIFYVLHKLSKKRKQKRKNLKRDYFRDGLILNKKDMCIFCLKCVEMCPMEIIELVDEGSDEQRISINTDRCIGCGVCAYNCPEEAISMIKKYDKVPVKNMMQAMTKTIEGRKN